MNRLKGLKLSKMIFHFGKHLAVVLLMQPIPIYSAANQGIQADAAEPRR
jgi:hypothetical protein